MFGLCIGCETPEGIPCREGCPIASRGSRRPSDTDRILEALALLAEAVDQDPSERTLRRGWHADCIRGLKSK